MAITINTPVGVHTVQGRDIYVKREDLCAPAGAPTFSKIRGLMPHLTKLKNEGYTTIGYVETSVSMAGWGVAWACAQLGLNAVIFDPQYKETPVILAYHRHYWEKYGATLIPIKAGMARVNWNISRKLLLERYGEHSVLLQLGLPLQESIQATADEMILTHSGVDFDTVVVNVGSGTIAAGVWRGLVSGSGIVYGVMGRTGDMVHKLKVIEDKAGCTNTGLFSSPWRFQLVDPGWAYTQASGYPCPFPCHPYYDRKAWEWLCTHLDELPGRILFWNIGH